MKISVKRTYSCLKADLIFQLKQGFLAVYLIVAVIYVIILSQLPQNVLQYAMPIVIFTDPSILGFIFIGGILMLEKQQGITNYLAVTPLKFREYISSKVISLGLLSVLISIVISLMAYQDAANYLIIAAVVFLTSVMFTLLGYIVSQKATSIYQFIM
jgi:fluoroquinolone transport system permease protein